MISVKIRHYNLGLLKHLAEIDITIYISPFDENIYFGFLLSVSCANNCNYLCNPIRNVSVF